MDHCSTKREAGVALLTTTIMILLVSILALTSINHSGSEMVAGARSRGTSLALHAADGGMQLALTRLMQSPPNTNPIDTNIGDFSVQSRTRADGAALDLDSLGTGPPPEGYSVNSGSGFVSEVFQVDMTSLGPDSSTTEIQSKLNIFVADSGSY